MMISDKDRLIMMSFLLIAMIVIVVAGIVYITNPTTYAVVVIPTSFALGWTFVSFVRLCARLNNG